MKNYKEMTKAGLIKELERIHRSGEIMDELKRTVQELKVHRIELEMQNRELQESRRELDLSHYRYSNLFNFAPVGYFIHNASGVINEINMTGAKLLGIERTWLLDTPFHLYVAHSDIQNFQKHLLKCKKSDKEITTESGLKRKNDGIFYVKLITVPVQNEEGRLYQTAIIDITEQRQIKDALICSEIRYRRLFESAKDGILILNAETGMIIDVNPFLIELLSYSKEQFIEKAIWEIGFFKDIISNKDKFLELQQTGYVRYENLPLERADGRKINVEFVSNVYIENNHDVIQCNIRDITDRKRAEKEQKQLKEKLNQSQKMEAIGTLAGGIAHDFNNILGGILGYTELTLDNVPYGTLAYSNLQNAIKGICRARALVKQILSFSRHSDEKKELLKISCIIKEAIALIRSTLPSTIEIRENIEAKSSRILADSTQIHQVLMNLSTNASYAMEEKGGVLEISLIRADLNGEVSKTYPELKPGPYVKLSVSDTGCGIKKEIIEKIFNPYFTTKEVGKGSGLGLSVTYGIVKKHGGEIKVYSKEGKGTVFQVFFPVVDNKVHEETEAVKAIPYGTEKILFVDDEKFLIDIGKQMLEKIGYKVTSTSSSLEALETFKKEPGVFDLVITDHTMPHMTGGTLAKEILSLRPDIPIILCTGYNDHINEEKARAIGIKEFIRKPSDKKEMTDAIRRALENSMKKEKI